MRMTNLISVLDMLSAKKHSVSISSFANK